MSSQADLIAYYQELLRPIVAGRKWLLFAEHLAGLTAVVRGIRALGADRPLALAAANGTGALPDPDEAFTHLAPLPSQPDDISHAFHVFESSLGSPPANVASAIDEWDPDRCAVSAGAIVLGDVPHVHGRPRYGRRDPRWASLEDKACVDEFWDRCGIPRAPSAIASSDAGELQRASAQLDQGQGTVWSGDTSRFIHGGGTGTRWVRGAEQFAKTASVFSRNYRRVRVMPFLEGIPCSIHGVVLGDAVAVLRPIEMVIFRRPGESEFVYSGFNSFWEPADADWQAMRALARLVGENLRDRLGYRGPYTIDGVLTADGFLPTELNARVGGAMSLYAHELPEFPFYPLLWAATEGESLDFRPEAFEGLLLGVLKREARGRCHTTVSGSSPFGGETKSFGLEVESDGGGFRLSSADASSTSGISGASVGKLTVGPSTMGTFLRFEPDPLRTPRGPSLAPAVRGAFVCAERELGIAVGRLDCAKSLR